MITFQELTIRNFLSYGNNTTTIKLDFTNPTLILGKNYDSVVNGHVDSNGAGKSTILNAIAFCLYDKPVSNIDKGKLVNYINNKNMEVSIVFKKGTTFYKVERYRKNKGKGGDGARIFINEESAVFDDKKYDKTPDSIANANKKIEEILGIPFDIFARIVVITASYEPFLSLPASHASKANQRDIIEELFGLTELTRKAELLKKVVSDTEAKLKKLADKNDMLVRERSRYEAQLASTVDKLQSWEENRKAEVKEIRAKIKAMAAIDVDAISEILTDIESINTEYGKLDSQITLINSKLDSAKLNNKKMLSWDGENADKINELKQKIQSLSSIDVQYLNSVVDKTSELSNTVNTKRTELNQLTTSRNKLNSELKKYEEEIEDLKGSKCPYCKQDFHEAADKIAECHDASSSLTKSIGDANTAITKLKGELEGLESELQSLKTIKIPHNLKTIETDIAKAKTQLEMLSNATNPFTAIDQAPLQSELDELLASSTKHKKTKDGLLTKLKSFDSSAAGYTEWTRLALNKIDSELEKLADRLERAKSSTNPFQDVVAELQNTLDNELDVPNTTEVDETYSELEHQKFLLKLLTKKDSFVRKALLNKNIPFLNARLAHYLESIGLRHKVLFTEEMGVKITQFNTEYDFENLSSGQRARVNLALAFAFRDVLQARFEKISFCILDECLDVGLSNVGVQLAIKMVKSVATSDNISMFVVSHRDEISSMFDAKLEVEMRDGFSNVKDSKLSSTNQENDE